MEAKNISAVVLAGGFGTRLSPLTDTTPKPLLKILDKSVLDITMEKLERLDISDIAVTAHYKWQKVAKAVKKYKNARLVLENMPLGTAGAVKNCFERVSGCVLVLSGDGIFDFDLEKILERHISEKADVTIVSKRCDNPTCFGVVLCNKDGRVTELVEKPPWKSVVSDLVNTGIYLLSPKVLDRIPKGRVYDFSRDLFPKLIEEGYDVRTVIANEYWCDIGSLDDYLKCNLDACFGRIKTVLPTECFAQKLKNVGIDARDCVYMGDAAVIGSNVVLEKGVVCADGCNIEKDCTVSASVLGSGVTVGKGSVVDGAIIADGVRVGENCIIGKGCVIAQDCEIKEGTVIENYTSVLSDGTTVNNLLLKDGGNMFVDDGTVLCEKADVKKLALSICSALEEQEKTEIGIGLICEDEQIKNSFAEGCSEKARVLVFNAADASMSTFCSVLFPNDITVVVEKMADKIKAVLLTPSGEKTNDSLERKISKQFMCLTEKDVNQKKKGTAKKIDGIDLMYSLTLTQAIKNMLCGLKSFPFEIAVDGKDNARKSLIQKVLKPFCPKADGVKRRLDITIDEDGFTVNENGKGIDFFHSLCALYSMNTPDIGLTLAYINENHPSAFEYEAQRAGVRCENALTVKNALLEAKIQDYLVCRENGFCLCAFLCLMSVSEKSIGEIKELLPSFEVYTDTYCGEKNRAHSMEKLCSLYGMGKRRQSGVCVTTSSGSVTVIPERIAGFRVISEAASFEAARELCERMGRAVVSESFEQDKNM